MLEMDCLEIWSTIKQCNSTLSNSKIVLFPPPLKWCTPLKLLFLKCIVQLSDVKKRIVLVFLKQM